MKRRPVNFLVSVKAKLFAGFMAMTLLIAGLGGYSLIAIGSAGKVVTNTFDRPLMAVNYARSASQTFAALELETLRPSDSDMPEVYFDWLSEQFIDELAISRERSISPKASEYFDDVDRDFMTWQARARVSLGTDWNRDMGDDLAVQIDEALDIIVELQTNESFRNRESAILKMSRIRQFTGLAVLTAIVLTLGLTMWIAVTIIRPLKAAAGAASQISAGKLNVEIPKGGDDETGQLLRTLRSMQSNIRARMVAEQDLRTLAQHRLSDSLENSKDAVLLTDVDGKIIVANPGVVTLFCDLLDGQCEGKLIGQDCGTLFAADGVPLGIEQTGPQKDNEFKLAQNGRWIRVNASATREGGRLFIWSDITESKQQSERLRIARDAAEAASRSKTLFLSAMSHEMNTPLNAIIGLSDILTMQQNRDGGDASTANMLGLISQSGNHMAQIVRDVLEIASDDVETFDLNALEVIDLSTPINRAVQSFHELAEQSDIRLIWAAPQDLFQIAGDSGDLEILAKKLIDNSIKFNRPGGAVKVQISAEGDAAVTLDIIDNGIGIEADQFDRILQPFAQIDEGYTRAVDGTGLGLCIAERIAKRHGTALKIRSTIGKGSAFSITFARKVADNVTNVDQTADAQPDGSSVVPERRVA